MEIKINDLTLFTEKVLLKSGLNYLPYPLTVSPKQVESFATNLRKKKPDFDWPERDDEKTYLPIGEYNLTIKAKNTRKTGILKIVK